LRKALTVSAVGVVAVKKRGLAGGNGSTGVAGAAGAGALGAAAGAAVWAKAVEAAREKKRAAAGTAILMFKEFLLGVMACADFCSDQSYQ
jgi:hypothetical protein